MNKRSSRLTYWTIFSASYGRLMLVLTGTMAVTVGGVFLRWSMGEALDTGNLQTSLLIITAVLLILTQIVSYIRQILFVSVQKNIYGKIQSKVLRGSMEELGKSSLGAITAYYTSDVGRIDSFVGRVVGTTFPDLVGWMTTVALLFWFDLYLGSAAILLTVLPALFLHRMSRPIAGGTAEYQEALEEANQSVATGLYNIESIKAACREDMFLRDNDEKLAALQKKKQKVAIWEALLGAPMLVSAFGTIILLSSLSGWLVLKGRITAGQLLTVVTLTDNIVSFVMRLDGTMSRFRMASVSLQRLNGFLAQGEERGGEQETGQIREIAFQDIYFAYPGNGVNAAQTSEGGQPWDNVRSIEGRPSLEKVGCMAGGHPPDNEHPIDGEIYHGFSEVWRQGAPVFLKGGNGQGKSTLIKLLMGIYNVSSGQISINGIPIQKYSLKSLREKIVVVPQENILFRGSIRDNLTCGRDVNRERIEEACRKAGIHEEILRMPDRYETLLTENGGALSGGQKQRLCLARALLREGEVYIFDEPTSALDTENRARFAELLPELSRDRIVVVITHEKELLGRAQQVMQMGADAGI